MINFRQYTNMTKCVVPNSVKITNSIWSSTFYGMKSLQHIQLPDTIKELRTTFCSCTKLVDPICGNSVTHLSSAYRSCSMLSRAVCGPNVVDMSHAYANCQQLYTAVCGPEVTNMSNAYYQCTNIQGNTYFYSPSINNVSNCFSGRNTSKMLNIYAPANSTTMTSLLRTGTTSIIGSSITWTNDTANKRYYNTTRNIYIYPVANVEATRIANGDPDYMGVNADES